MRLPDSSDGNSRYSGQSHRTFSIGKETTAYGKGCMTLRWRHSGSWRESSRTAPRPNEARRSRRGEVIHERGFSTYDDLVHGVNQYPPIYQTKTRKRHDSREMVFRENMVIVISSRMTKR